MSEDCAENILQNANCQPNEVASCLCAYTTGRVCKRVYTWTRETWEKRYLTIEFDLARMLCTENLIFKKTNFQIQ